MTHDERVSMRMHASTCINMHAYARHMHQSICSFMCVCEAVYMFKCLNTCTCSQVKALGTLAMIDEGELDWKVGLQA